MDKILDRCRTRFDPAIAKLIGAALGSLAIYLLAFTLPANLFTLYQRDGLVGGLLQQAGLNGFWRLSTAFIGVGLFYILGLRAARQTSSKTAWRIVIGGTLGQYLLPSAGPIFYERIGLGPRFAELVAMSFTRPSLTNPTSDG